MRPTPPVVTRFRTYKLELGARRGHLLRDDHGATGNAGNGSPAARNEPMIIDKYEFLSAGRRGRLPRLREVAMAPNDRQRLTVLGPRQSPPDLIVASTIGLSGILLDGTDVYWLEVAPLRRTGDR